MTQEFDKLISNSAPVVPDSGASRRMARTLLHEKMRGQEQRRRRRDRRGMSLAACLVLLVVIGGQVVPLGSDGFDFELAPLVTGSGETISLVKNEIRGSVINAPPSYSEADIYELQQQNMLREGTVKEIEGFSFNGKTPYWQVTYLSDINGKLSEGTRAPTNTDFPNGILERNSIPFMINERPSFMVLVEAGQIAAKPYGLITSDGVTFEVQQWSKQYAEWGLFTYYRGRPVDHSPTSH